MESHEQTKNLRLGKSTIGHEEGRRGIDRGLLISTGTRDKYHGPDEVTEIRPKPSHREGARCAAVVGEDHTRRRSGKAVLQRIDGAGVWVAGAGACSAPHQLRLVPPSKS